MSTPRTILAWIAQAAAAAILLQTLFFKFSGAEESIYIFETLGAEPLGRYGSGVVELAAAILLLIPSRAALGGFVAAGVMAGAIGSHLTVLGIDVLGDGGTLFAMAWVVLIASATVIVLRREGLPVIARRLVPAL
jgi:hypothetical protein